MKARGWPCGPGQSCLLQGQHPPGALPHLQSSAPSSLGEQRVPVTHQGDLGEPAGGRSVSPSSPSSVTLSEYTNKPQTTSLQKLTLDQWFSYSIDSEIPDIKNIHHYNEHLIQSWTHYLKGLLFSYLNAQLGRGSERMNSAPGSSLSRWSHHWG